MSKIYLVTGAAGFIGFHLSLQLLEDQQSVVGLDNLNDYYDVQLKLDRLSILRQYPTFTFYQQDLVDLEGMQSIFRCHPIQIVCHLAAQAGVRYSLVNPFVYQKSNLEGFLNLIEICRHAQIENFVYASSSSVYGKNKTLPFRVEDAADQPISLYAATKKANELMAHSYSHLYGLPTTGLRFFTVYGPWGRPDMAFFSFTKAILQDEPVQLYNHGQMKRDFTYIDDVIQGIRCCLENPQSYKIFNIGNKKSEDLERFVDLIEECLGKKAIRIYASIQPGDLAETYADIEPIQTMYGYEPKTTIEQGIPQFVEWYRSYYKEKESRCKNVF